MAGRGGMFSQRGVKRMASYISINPPEYEADSYVEQCREQSLARLWCSRSALTSMELLINFMFFIDHLISQACPAPPHLRPDQLPLITSADCWLDGGEVASVSEAQLCWQVVPGGWAWRGASPTRGGVSHLQPEASPKTGEVKPSAKGRKERTSRSDGQGRTGSGLRPSADHRSKGRSVEEYRLSSARRKMNGRLPFTAGRGGVSGGADLSRHMHDEAEESIIPKAGKPLPRVRKPNLHSDREQDSNPCGWRHLGPPSTHDSTVPRRYEYTQLLP
ncbi:hypothetical protein E2C01_048274 [Portunus trituberculatus]|uniref:Uncharacterized protein n=1 Tax=Portunus trituberculatus TaxID=210409 RepID=A0A5B7GAQ2_PORTR|nr:hypothetical protein [Portunus trituberculatus]